MATTTPEGSTPAPGKPRIWVCGWDWCPQTFRQGNDLAKHLQDVHFNNIVAVKKSDWNDYLRSVEGQSGGTGSWMADIPSGSIPTHSPDPSIGQLSPLGPGGAQQHSPSLPPSTPLKPQIPRNLSRPRASFQQSPATSQPANPSPLRTSASPITTSPHVHVHKPSASSNSGMPRRASTSDSDAPAAKRRRTTSFAGYTAQSSPMSTPSVSSMPPSPALSNMITDAINAAGRINAGTLTPSPRAAHTQTARRGRRPSGGGSGNSLPRRTGMGVSPPIAHANAPRSLVEVLSRAATSPTPAFGAAPFTSSSSSFRAHASIRSSTSAQAVEDALTQDLGPSVASSPARSQLQSGVNSLKSSSSQSTSSQSHAERARQSSSQTAEHSSFHGSHAVESQFAVAHSPESYSYTQGHTAASQSAQSAAPPPDTRPPIPRTRRAQSHAQSQSQAQSQAPPQAQNKSASSGASLPVPIPRNLRPRSRTPAVAQAPAPAPAPAATPPGPYADLVEALVRAHDPSQHSPPIPRRTTRSRAGSSANSAQATSAAGAAGGTSEVGGAGQKGKRAQSKPPSTGPVRRSSRARSRTPSYEAGAGAGGGKAQAKSRGLPAVDEQPDDEDAAPAQGVPASQAQPQPPSQSLNRFRSGTTYVPIPRRTQRPPPQAQAQAQSQLRSRSPSRPKGPVAPVKPDPDAEEGGTGAAMDVDAPVLSSQVGSERQTQKGNAGQSQSQGQSQHPSQSQSQDAEDSQGSEGRGYVEGYGFDMGSLVLQTQAPYKWSQSP